MKILIKMKGRLLICSGVFLLIVIFAWPWYFVLAADNAVKLYNINASIDQQRQVTISGNISNGSGNEVTIRIQSPSGNAEYVNSVMSMTDGEFECQYKLRNKETGVYQVYISAKGLSMPVNKSFTYGIDNTLKELSSDSQTLSPEFSPEVTEYKVTVNPKVKQLTVNAAVNDSTATAAVNGSTMIGESFSQSINLAEGDNKITVEVTALSGRKKDYQITVNRLSSNSAALTAEAKIDKNKMVTVEGKVNTGQGQRVTLRIMDPLRKTEYINDTLSTENGKFSFSYPMKNTVMGRYMVELGAENLPSAVVTYFNYGMDADLSSLTADRIGFDPAFNRNSLVYFAELNSSIGSICLTPIANDQSAGISVNGAKVPSGQKSQQILLHDGINEIKVCVTAADGNTQKTYTVYVTRNQSVAVDNKLEAKINKLKQVTIKGYLQKESSGEATILVRDPKGKIDFIDNVSLSEGTFFSTYQLKNNERGKYTVSIGNKNLNTTDVTTFLYDPGNAELENLILNGTRLIPSFDKTITDYFAFVEYGTAQITVKPVACSQNATIKVNQNALENGENSPEITLQVGNNLIDVEVTSEDGSEVKNYTVTVTRQSQPAATSTPAPTPTPTQPPTPQPSSDATLGSVSVTAGGNSAEVNDPSLFASDLGFTPDYLYRVTDSNISTVDITLTTNDANASGITINGEVAESGVPVNESISLNGDGWYKKFNIVVTAQDQTTTKSYSLVIIPAPTLP